MFHMSVTELIQFAGENGMGVKVAVWPEGDAWVAIARCQFLDGKGATPKWEGKGATAAEAADHAAGHAHWFWKKTL